jgi:hypothetical protein
MIQTQMDWIQIKLQLNSNLVIAIYVSVLYEASALVHCSDKKCLPFIGKSF